MQVLHWAYSYTLSNRMGFSSYTSMAAHLFVNSLLIRLSALSSKEYYMKFPPTFLAILAPYCSLTSLLLGLFRTMSSLFPRIKI